MNSNIYKSHKYCRKPGSDVDDAGVVPLVESPDLDGMLVGGVGLFIGAIVVFEMTGVVRRI